VVRSRSRPTLGNVPRKSLLTPFAEHEDEYGAHGEAGQGAARRLDDEREQRLAEQLADAAADVSLPGRRVVGLDREGEPDQQAGPTSETQEIVVDFSSHLSSSG
jgi:hypothetical protein